jgi:short-subunit dehydrogenase
MAFQHVFITGASSGLGRGLALHYARQGATVHAAARRGNELEALARDAQGASGRIVPVVVDVAETEALVGSIRTAEAASGGALDLVIANAGVGSPTNGARLRWETVAQLCDVNVRGACVTIAAALPAMVERKSGTVVGVSSLAAFRGLPRNAGYSASKAALSVFLEGLRVDLRKTGVRALTIYPGYVKTEMTAKNKGAQPFLMEAEDAVRIMAEGIDRGRSRIAYPLPTATAMHVVGALPGWLYESLAGLGK